MQQAMGSPIGSVTGVETGIRNKKGRREKCPRNPKRSCGRGETLEHQPLRSPSRKVKRNGNKTPEEQQARHGVGLPGLPELMGRQTPKKKRDGPPCEREALGRIAFASDTPAASKALCHMRNLPPSSVSQVFTSVGMHPPMVKKNTTFGDTAGCVVQ